MVEKELVIELQQIINEDYDKEISFKEASKIANTITAYFDLLIRTYHDIKLNEKSH